MSDNKTNQQQQLLLFDEDFKVNNRDDAKNLQKHLDETKKRGPKSTLRKLLEDKIKEYEQRSQQKFYIANVEGRKIAMLTSAAPERETREDNNSNKNNNNNNARRRARVDASDEDLSQDPEGVENDDMLDFVEDDPALPLIPSNNNNNNNNSSE